MDIMHTGYYVYGKFCIVHYGTVGDPFNTLGTWMGSHSDSGYYGDYAYGLLVAAMVCHEEEERGDRRLHPGKTQRQLRGPLAC